jgi:hypothetical protein
MILEIIIKVGSLLAYPLAAHIDMPLLLIIYRESGEETPWQCSTCSNFLFRSPGKPHNWSQHRLWAHRLFGNCLCGWLLKIFKHFLSLRWCLVTLNVRHLQLTLNRPWNVNAIQKQLCVSCFLWKLFSLHLIRLPVVLQFWGIECEAGVEDVWRTTCDLSFVVCYIMLTCFVMWKSRISMMQSNGPFIKLDALKTIHVSHLHMECAGFYGNTCILYLGGTCF